VRRHFVSASQAATRAAIAAMSSCAAVFQAGLRQQLGKTLGKHTPPDGINH
jgi:hypothetical protein